MSDYIDCIYWGIFFSDTELIESSLERDIPDKHITFAFRQPCPTWLVGQEVCVTVIGYGNDGKNEALLVEMPADVMPFYQGAESGHITLSVAQDGKPVDSAWLNFESLAPWTAYGHFGYFGLDYCVHTAC